MDNELGTWLSNELARRGLSHRQFAKQALIAHSLISRVISGETKATADFCIKIANALGESPERLLRLAGYLPPAVAAPDNDPTLQTLFNLLPGLSPDQRKEVLRYVRYIHERGSE